MAKFLTWDITKHINKMTMASTIGILSIFIVDFVDMYFLSILWESELIAAVWFAWIILFMLVSIGIALMITMASLVSTQLWEWNKKKSKNTAMSILYFAFFISIPLLLVSYVFARDLLQFIWAEWQTLEYALSYFKIILLSLPFMLIWMAATGILRWVWDAKFGMMPTLVAGWVNLVLDPIFIFWFGWWIEWAALATALSRVAMFIVAFYGAIKHKFLVFCSCFKLKDNITAILAIFIPAMLTNIATPVWTWFILKSISEYWDDVVAAMAVMWRLTPVLFVYIFWMSWAIWGIIGQNYWAKNYPRVYEIIKKSILISFYYIVWAVWVLIISHNFIIKIFWLQWDWVELFKFYSYFLSIFFIFNAILFIWNATFNVIGKAYLSTITNILKSIVFLIPFVYILGNNFWMKWILFSESLSVLITWILTLILLKIYLPKEINT